jgi:hypothetical protein
VQLIEGSAIFAVTCNVSYLRVDTSELKLTLNSDERVQQFRERQRMRSFLLRLMLDYLECIHQFKEFILMCFSREHHRNRRDIDGILSSPFQKRFARESFCLIVELFRTLSIWTEQFLS